MKILFIVESPGKVSKISSILGKNYVVKASKGIFRDLDSKKMSIDFENKFKPIYVITKPDVVHTLRSETSKVDMVYLASDLDREGEGIAQSMIDVLKPNQYKRVIFNCIAKNAIAEAIKNAGMINKPLVDAQKARRVIDRLFGYMISPELSHNLGGKLSAGRVQSVASRAIVDRENEINKFLHTNGNSSNFRVHGLIGDFKSTLYTCNDKNVHNTKSLYHGDIARISLLDNDNPHQNVIKLLKLCLKSKYNVHAIQKKTSIRNASPPFTTSTLQQEAARKLHMSIDTTMRVAQKLYEAGFITYMRTDSVAISNEAHVDLQKVIIDVYGKQYYKKNIYKSRVANSQEGHECCRPTHPDLIDLSSETNDADQIKLYDLIWKRTIASQMKPAEIEITVIQISISKYLELLKSPYYYFQSQIEKIIFAGFMKVYIESTDDEIDDNYSINTAYRGSVPEPGNLLTMQYIDARQEYLKPPVRFSQSSLVRRLEILGIGRPSTYVNTIKTIIDRGYVKIGNVNGIAKPITTYSIQSENKKHIMTIFKEESTTLLGKETGKIIATTLGTTVTKYLLENFTEILDYDFTAKMEQKLDDIANGKLVWHTVVQQFYDKLQPCIEKIKKSGNLSTNDRLLGCDTDNHQIYTANTKWGPRLKKNIDGRFIYTNIAKDTDLNTITLKQAIKLFEYPKLLGKHKSENVLLNRGEYGYYLTYGTKKISITDHQIANYNLQMAIDAIANNKQNDIKSTKIKLGHKNVTCNIRNGVYGPYIQVVNGKTRKNYSIPKTMDPNNLSTENINELVSKKTQYSKNLKKNNHKQSAGKGDH